ncbi:hypothetical protein B0H16DRAFT_1743304 [Mycena metata]|uniref:Uncharacterized protein n=1 Tax=Mycena metata TaxID=1033252 RepID=A0AAD7H6B5_9AGAR|nr:hypothetical protein B0H16DRAFT_1743304 [Mycena metata]
MSAIICPYKPPSVARSYLFSLTPPPETDAPVLEEKARTYGPASAPSQLIIGCTGDPPAAPLSSSTASLPPPSTLQPIPSDRVTKEERTKLKEALGTYQPAESDPDDDRKTLYVPVWLEDAVAHGHYDGHWGRFFGAEGHPLRVSLRLHSSFGVFVTASSFAAVIRLAAPSSSFGGAIPCRVLARLPYDVRALPCSTSPFERGRSSRASYLLPRVPTQSYDVRVVSSYWVFATEPAREGSLRPRSLRPLDCALTVVVWRLSHVVSPAPIVRPYSVVQRVLGVFVTEPPAAPLSPLFHYLLWQDIAPEDTSQETHYAAYAAANQAFAERIKTFFFAFGPPPALRFTYPYLLLDPSPPFPPSPAPAPP